MCVSCRTRRRCVSDMLTVCRSLCVLAVPLCLCVLAGYVAQPLPQLGCSRPELEGERHRGKNPTHKGVWWRFLQKRQLESSSGREICKDIPSILILNTNIV